MNMLRSRSLIAIVFFVFLSQAQAREPHVITFRSKGLYPEGLAYDPAGQTFLAGAIRDRRIVSVSDAGVTETLVSDLDLPVNASFVGLAVDHRRNRVLAAVTALAPQPAFHALAAYDIRTRQRLFLSPLPAGDAKAQPIANGVAVDFAGHAYVTNSGGNFIWKVSETGEASIFSDSPAFSAHPIVVDPQYSFCGINGVAYVSKGYLLVVQSNTGKLFKVSEHDGTARQVLLNEDLPMADGIAVRGDGVVFVVSAKLVWVLKSHDNWGEAVVFDKITLDADRFATSLTVGRHDTIYVIYGHTWEGMSGNSTREVFGIEEVRSEKENADERVWIYVLVGLGLTYFMVWRFQMRKLIANMDKKIN